MRSTFLPVLVVACHAASVSMKEGHLTPTQLHDVAQSVQHLTDAQKECIENGKYNASQFNEDLTLLPYLATISQSLGQAGSFVEIGALDGLMYSNTLMFERCLGWHGLLIEGNPMNAEKLLKCGRTQVAFETKAVCQGTGFVTMTVGGFAVAGEIDQMNPKELEIYNTSEHYNETVQVPCREMGAMMNDAGMTDSADMTTYLSLDVEGAEAKVLSTLNPARFSLILVEVWEENAEFADSGMTVHDHLHQAGMIKVTSGPLQKVGLNFVYMSPNAYDACQRAGLEV